MLSILGRWFYSRRSRDIAVLAVLAVGVLAPFANKAFHIDDPLFVWAARHIAEHPFDFYGFDVLWYSTWERMADVTQNPPLGCYYLALVGTLFGWEETALHLAMIVPAFLGLWGVYRLAARLGATPLPAALLTLATPVFLLSATSVMCDVPMLALWLWAVVFWDEGLRDRQPGRLWLAGGLIAVTTLTKYFGICLVPLLGVYAHVVDRGGRRRWLPPLGLALLLLLGYEVLTWAMYGHPMLTWAMGYAARFGTPTIGTKAFRIGSGLSFFGGCFGAAAVLTPFLIGRAGRIGLVVAAAFVLGLSLFLTGEHEVGEYYFTDSPLTFVGGYYSPVGSAGESATLEAVCTWAAILGQFLFWATAGAGLAFMVWQDYQRNRDDTALLLGLWIAGTFAFATFVNWTLNGRSVLPLVPAVAIVLVRRLSRMWGTVWPSWSYVAIVGPSLALALVIADADKSTADAQRRGAARILEQFGERRPLWYSGHWGFQHYMMEGGALPWDGERDRGLAGDLIAIPDNNCNMAPLKWKTRTMAEFAEPVRSYVTTMQYERAAGFYAEIWGPLPFTFGAVPPERFRVEQLVLPLPGKPKTHQ